MQKGVEIRLKDLESRKSSVSRNLHRLFIKIPQVEMVLDEINNAINLVDSIEDSIVRVIYGDYGHGKSQTANLVLEHLTNAGYSNRLFHLENITYFRNFIINSSISLYNQIAQQGKTLLIKVDALLKKLQDRTYVDAISLGNLISDYLRLLIKLAQYDFTVIIFLDELDRIVHDERDQNEWIDFFVAINDQDNLKILLVCFVPQQSAELIRSADTRMERWGSYFDSHGIYLTGKYENRLYEGVANIFALSSIFHKKNVTEQDLNFVYAAYKHRESFLQSTSIRAVNIYSVNVSEVIFNCHKFDLWGLFNSFNRMELTNKGRFIERKFRNLLINDNLPQFELRRDDSDEKIVFRVEYFTENLSAGSEFSDGHYMMYQRISGSELEEATIAVVMKYADNDNLEQSQVEKIKKLSQEYPTIFVSLGPSKETGLRLQSELKEFVQNNVRHYPILVINIPLNLFPPLLIAPDDKAENFGRVKGTLRTWSKAITDHHNQLVHFFRELPNQLTERQIILRAYELTGIEPSVVPIAEGEKVISQEMFADRTPSLQQALDFCAGNIVSTFNTVKSFKQQDTLKSGVHKIIKSRYPEFLSQVMGKFDEMISYLISSDFLKYGKRGKKVTIKKNPGWDDEAALQAIKDQLMEK